MSTFTSRHSTPESLLRFHRRPESALTTIAQVVPMPDTAPLPLSIELANKIHKLDFGVYAYYDDDGSGLVPIIDETMRPLVEALQAVRTAEAQEPNERLPIEVYDLVRSALRSAGIPSGDG